MSPSSSKVIILTGASRGIGLAIARYLLSHKHLVVLIARSAEPLERLATEFPDQAVVLASDVTLPDLPSHAVDLAIKKFSRLDALIINHGVLDPVSTIKSLTRSTHDTDILASWRHSYEVNFFSAVALVHASIPTLRQTKGRVVFTSSGAAATGYQAWGAYGSAKAAMNHLCMTVASEEPDLVAIAVRPGVVDTDMQRDIREKHSGAMSSADAAKFHGLNARKELLRPEGPGEVIARLALGAPKELSGRFVSWNADELKAFQSDA